MRYGSFASPCHFQVRYGQRHPQAAHLPPFLMPIHAHELLGGLTSHKASSIFQVCSCRSSSCFIGPSACTTLHRLRSIEFIHAIDPCQSILIPRIFTHTHEPLSRARPVHCGFIDSPWQRHSDARSRLCFQTPIQNPSQCFEACDCPRASLDASS
jgi:hypothetical protein